MRKKKRTPPVSKLLRPVKEPLRFKKPSSPSENTKYMRFLNNAIKEAEKEKKANIAQKNNKSSPSNENKKYNKWFEEELKKIINNENRKTNRQGNTIMREASPIGSGKNKRR
jgi:tRNA nucleotidyltransferase/poly(A) polymerase